MWCNRNEEWATCGERIWKWHAVTNKRIMQTHVNQCQRNIDWALYEKNRTLLWMPCAGNVHHFNIWPLYHKNKILAINECYRRSKRMNGLFQDDFNYFIVRLEYFAQCSIGKHGAFWAYSVSTIAAFATLIIDTDIFFRKQSLTCWHPFEIAPEAGMNHMSLTVRREERITEC